MAPSQYPVNSPSPLDRIAGNYVELDDMKAERSPTWSTKDEYTNVKTKETIPSELPARPRIEDDGSSNWWIFESVAWLISAIALAIIIAVVAITDGKPLPTWPMHITLNSFVSFMSTLMKAAAVVPVAECISQLKWLWFRRAGAVHDIQTFDEASRGTWGSAKLLFVTRGIHLAKLGALITIIMLAIDPFVQQVITYQKEPIMSTHSNSSVPIASMYSDYSFGSMMALREPTMTMKAAINNGMYDTADTPQLDFPISATCATGNCTWPSTYKSLAVCSKCSNTTSLMTTSCDEPFGPWPAMCNYTLPNSMFFNGQLRGNMYLNSSGSYDSLAYNNSQSTFATLSTMRGLHDLSSTNLLGVVSNECVLYFCVNEYHSNVTNGAFTETLVASYTGDRNPEDQQNITISVPGTGKEYWVGAQSWYALRSHFLDYWTGNVSGSTGRLSSTSDILTALYTFGEDGSGSGTQKIGGENDTVAAIAAAMTKVLRMYDIPSNTSLWVTNATALNATTSDRFALGTAWTIETFVHVRWLWMILPIVLEVLILGFLVGTILQSNRSGLPGWKSSTLPLIQGKLSEMREAIAEKRRSRV
ncbi:uncharacterized protein JN550_002882 [Neoarthrinium moseri]|uniref:uncharacterized protein n=1 Tax=Neoarthrinium moseri TaxID=1658444 RepID=UPI001FDE47E0|nr:uncharacterized protein JN550_002882 [Neoarthrinium moseri]KAI1874303.1 hypothetical protein JN550_002882 [Neoarthrinium moseri]